MKTPTFQLLTADCEVGKEDFARSDPAISMLKGGGGGGGGGDQT